VDQPLGAPRPAPGAAPQAAPPPTTVTRRERHGETWLATEPASADPSDLVAVLGPALAGARDDGAAVVHWETDAPEAVVDEVAGALGLPGRRAVLQMRRPLPLEPALVEATTPVAVRPLRPGTADEAAWVRCNNRSFAGHPDQGHETVESLRATMAQPWFDPAGLLLAEGPVPVDDGGDLDGFCWTKVHPPDGVDPALGEIYVIGIDPSAGGRGLGRSLTVAGLDHLALTTDVAVLYVDDANVAARRLYDRLGFGVHHTRWVRTTGPAADADGSAADGPDAIPPP
jgi:mycothiol synthase